MPMTRVVAHRRLRLLAGAFAALVLALAGGSVRLELQRTRHHATDAAGQVAGALADADREHFRIHVQDPSREVGLSAPVIGRSGFVGDRPFLAPVRLSVGPDGRQRIGAFVAIPGFDAHGVATDAEPDLLARLRLPKSLLLGAVVLLSLAGFWWLVLRRERAEDSERAAREAASASAREVRSIVEHLDEVVWSAEPETRAITYVSPACERVFGRTADAFRRDRNLWLAVIHPEDRERVEARFRATDFRAEGFDARYRIVRPDGTAAWVRETSHGVLGPDGRLERIGGIVTDVTDTMAALEALAASRSSLEAVVQATVDALVTIDEDGRIETFNEAARRMFGYAPEEMIGRDVTVLMPEGHAARHAGYIRNYIDTGEARIIGIGREVEGRHRDGSLFPLDLSVGEWRAGGRRHFTAVMRDLTRRCAIEAALRRAQRLEAVGRLTSGIAHDFNNLLTPIAGYASLMAEGFPEGSQEREDLEVILRAASRGRDLVAQMMAFAREDSPVPTPVPVDQAITEAVRLVAPTVPGGVDLRVLSPGVGLSVLADRQRIGRLLLNLLSNALHAMEGRRGAVTIRAEHRTGPAPGPDGSWRDPPAGRGSPSWWRTTAAAWRRRWSTGPSSPSSPPSRSDAARGSGSRPPTATCPVGAARSGSTAGRTTGPGSRCCCAAPTRRPSQRPGRMRRPRTTDRRASRDARWWWTTNPTSVRWRCACWNASVSRRRRRTASPRPSPCWTPRGRRATTSC
jgi:two-component system sensor kinase FixL